MRISSPLSRRALMVVVTLSAYDDVSGWAAFRLALLLSRRDVVLGRYATVAVTCLASAVFGIALSALVGPVEAAVLPLVTGETLATGWNLSDALALAVAGISLSITYMPTSARRAARSRPSCGRGLPSMSISPESMVSRRLIVRHSVDLPEPEGPITTTTSPLSTEKLMSLSTCS